MDELARRVLAQFQVLGKDTLDLHALFEAGGNDPGRRDAIVDVVEKLAGNGLLEDIGSDFYKITEAGRSAARSR